MRGFTSIICLVAAGATAVAASSDQLFNSRLESRFTKTKRASSCGKEIDILQLLNLGHDVQVLNQDIQPILTKATDLVTGLLTGNITEVATALGGELKAIEVLVIDLISKSKKCPKKPKTKSKPKKKAPHPKVVATSSSIAPLPSSSAPAPAPVATKAHKKPSHGKKTGKKSGSGSKKCPTCMTTKEIAALLAKVLKEVDVLLNAVDDAVAKLPIVGPILGPIVSDIDGQLGTLLTTLENILPGLLDLVCKLLQSVNGLLAKLGLGSLISGLGIQLKV